MNNNKLPKVWIAVVIFAPFILMFCLHIGIALGSYFGIKNIKNMDASTWFLFFGSYLGGVMTLAGVMITLKYERKIHQHEKILESINDEKDQLGKAVCELNIYGPSTIYRRFCSLQITSEGYNAAEIATIQQAVSEEMAKINKFNIETMFFTDISAMRIGCSTCVKPCGIQSISSEYLKLYEIVGKKIYDTLQEIDYYVTEVQINAIFDAEIKKYQKTNKECLENGQQPLYSEDLIKEYKNRIVDVKPRQDKIIVALAEIGKYNQNEIQQLSHLARSYIAVKCQNAYKQCFSNKQENK